MSWFRGFCSPDDELMKYQFRAAHWRNEFDRVEQELKEAQALSRDLIRERDRALEEIRVREESQIPVAPRILLESLERAERERDEALAAYDALGERYDKLDAAVERLEHGRGA